MGKIGADFLVGVLGVIVLAHAAYATIIYRGELKIKEEEFVRPPLPVLLEVATSLALCFWAALRVPGTFLPILPDSKENRHPGRMKELREASSGISAAYRLSERADVIKPEDHGSDHAEWP